MVDSLAINDISAASIRKVELSPTQRWLSLAELVAGAAIVIGHNVYHVIPNEVPIFLCSG
ncbi:MAG: hypothetical protein DMG97_12450 [Acidobacteria bacterium]|nr:MAG: hypothetical protein DMG97_12450 [Acidobacteriota bacterium]PYV74827.1 MAG: hypothetical protein DMG96_19135 [Acidobacteriota bacterium]